jgi:hypothetical protein
MRPDHEAGLYRRFTLVDYTFGVYRPRTDRRAAEGSGAMGARSRASRARKLRGVCAGTALFATGLIATAGAASAGAATSAQVQAKKHLLVLSDMPKGWKAEKGTGGTGGGSGLSGGSGVAACIGVPAAVVNDNSPGESSPYYENKDGSLEVQDDVTVFPSPAYATRELDAMGSSKTPDCLQSWINGAGKSSFESAAGKGVTLGKVTVSALDPAVYGTGVTGVVANLPITYRGVTVNGQLISVNFNKGRLGQSITYTSYLGGFPNSLGAHLASVARGRL